MLNSLPVCCYGDPINLVDLWGVFGNRNGSNVNNVQNNGNYWSATENNSNNANYLNFNSDEANMNNHNRCNGHSVRLVKHFPPPMMWLMVIEWFAKKRDT